MPGQPGMNTNMTMNVNVSGGQPGMVQPGAERPTSQVDPNDIQARYQHREKLLPDYLGLIGIIESKGHNVTELRRLHKESQLTDEDLRL